MPKTIIPENVLMAATGLLLPYYPKVSPSSLVAALEEPLPKNTDGKKRLSPAEYAEIMGISRMTVMRMIHRGDLDSVQVGRQYRILI